MKRLWLGLIAVGVAAVAFAASTLTTNFGLTKPGVGDTGWGTAVNANFTALDLIGNFVDTTGYPRSGVIKSSHVFTNGIAGSNLEANCVKSSHVVDGTLTGADLAANTITGSNLGSAIVKSSHVFTNGLSGSNLEANCVVSSMVVDGTLTGADLAANTLTGNELGLGIIKSSHVSTNGIAGSNLQADAVVSTHIAAGAVTSTDLATNGVAGSNVQANAIVASHTVVNVSSTIFQEGYNVQAERLSTTDVTGATQTASSIGGATDDIVTLSGTTGITKVMVAMSANLNSTNYDARAILYVDGTVTTTRLFSNLSGGDNCSLTGIVTVTSAASHTFEMRYCKSSRLAGTFYVDGRRLQVWAVGN